MSGGTLRDTSRARASACRRGPAADPRPATSRGAVRARGGSWRESSYLAFPFPERVLGLHDLARVVDHVVLVGVVLDERRQPLERRERVEQNAVRRHRPQQALADDVLFALLVEPDPV